MNFSKNDNQYYLKDRNNKFYKLVNNELTHGTTILNCNKTNLIDNIKELEHMGITNYRIELLDESYDETKEIIERVKKQNEWFNNKWIKQGVKY